MYPTFQALRARFIGDLSSNYKRREAGQLFFEVISYLLKWDKSDLAMKIKDRPITQTERDVLIILNRLMEGEPYQYVLGRAWFLDSWYQVNPSVLIPRPETEELVHWILNDHLNEESQILDIGTGSGVIAISIAKNRPKWGVFGSEVSADALKVARLNQQNVLKNNNLNLYLDDILNPIITYDKKLDIIVSNPPYIHRSESNSMNLRVTAHEPTVALFVDDDDALSFYRHILVYARDNLKNGGKLFLEIHEDMAEDVVMLLKTNEFVFTELRKDMQGKNRMVRAVKL